jgi:C4-dicarboxylate-binding protein DctP
MFAEEAEKLSNGDIKIDVFPASQLGGIAEMLSSVQAGSLDFTLAVPAWYSNFIKPMDVFTLPYLVKSQDLLRPALDGALGEKISQFAEQEGFKIVGFWLMGGRHIVNRVREVSTPDQMDGLKVRVINSQVYMQTYRAMGANPVAMDPSELYLALQQGVVDGFEYPLPDLIPYKLYEVASHLTLDQHTTDFFIISMNKAKWDGLSDGQKDILNQAMKKAMDWQWEQQPKDIATALEKLKELMQVNEITPEQRAAFIKATEPVYAEFKDKIGAELVDVAVRELSPK